MSRFFNVPAWEENKQGNLKFPVPFVCSNGIWVKWFSHFFLITNGNFHVQPSKNTIFSRSNLEKNHAQFYTLRIELILCWQTPYAPTTSQQSPLQNGCSNAHIILCNLINDYYGTKWAEFMLQRAVFRLINRLMDWPIYFIRKNTLSYMICVYF